MPATIIYYCTYSMGVGYITLGLYMRFQLLIFVTYIHPLVSHDCLISHETKELKILWMIWDRCFVKKERMERREKNKCTLVAVNEWKAADKWWWFVLITSHFFFSFFFLFWRINRKLLHSHKQKGSPHSQAWVSTAGQQCNTPHTWFNESFC